MLGVISRCRFNKDKEQLERGVTLVEDASEKQKIFCGAQGHAIVADMFGEGSPILLAHGGGQTRLAWTRTARALMQAGYSAIAMDLRGHGESAWSPSGSYQLDDFAMDLLAMSDQLDEKPALVGASLGGLAGLIAEVNFAPDPSLRLRLSILHQIWSRSALRRSWIS